MTNCCVVNCSNSYYRLQRWLKSVCDCEAHNGQRKSDCGCKQPFQFFSFPKKEPSRSEWIKNVNRKQGKENWNPKPHTRICSAHFVDHAPSVKNPYPVLAMGYEIIVKSARKPPKIREMEPVCITHPNETLQTDIVDTKVIGCGISRDHSYAFSYNCDCCLNCECVGCLQKQLEIQKLQARILYLEKDLEEQQSFPRGFSLDSITKSDKKVRLYLGLPTRRSFFRLLNLVTPKCKNMRYWKGRSNIRVISTKLRKDKSVKRKPGPGRKLSIKQEFMLTLLKLRLNLTFDFLSDLFCVSITVASQVFTTWICFLSKMLSALIYHPSKEEVKQTLPKAFKDHVPNARGIIDCSEFFIERPNSLDIQVATWSDYKHHNTVKVLVDISPTGIIQFISKAWGGRTSDKHVVLHSGYLDTIEPGDVILADRGFPIAEELILRGARLYIPPGARGAEQMTRDKVHKTKKIANLRIHVERAINRRKWFRILSETLPITMVPLIDDILVVCSALINLYPPLVK